jgi:serine/threonine protein phosphatase PrpC
MKIATRNSFSVSETEVGRKNIDIIYPAYDSIDKKNRLFITCGGNSEESLLAGQVVCDTVKTYFYSFLDNNITVEFIEKAIRMGEIALSELKKGNSDWKEMTTPLTLFYLDFDCVYLCQVSESHIYQIRNNKIIYKSIDISTNKKIQGGDNPVEINVVILKDIQDNDQFFICNGGITCSEDEEFICRVLSEPQANSDEKLSQIKNFCLKKKYQNLFSAHLIPIQGIKETQSFKQRVNALVYSFI